jgi:vitamin B12 transporter
MRLSPLALSAALLPAPLLAEPAGPPAYDAALKLPETLVTANREVGTRSESSAASTVFTREDIDRLQPSSVADLLDRVPGVQTVRSGGLGSTTGLYIRGTKSAQSLVLVDGQRIASASAGGAPLELLSVEQIERIEVLRGPRSALYGSDALGGVVQIFTRRAAGEGLRARLHLGYGNRATWQRSLGLSGGDRDTQVNLSASADATAGIDRTRSGHAPDDDRDAYRNNAVSLNLHRRLAEDGEAGFSLLDQRGQSEYDQGWQGGYPYNDFQLSSYSGYVEQRFAERWKSRVELGHSENRSVERFDDSAAYNPFATYRDAASWLNSLELGAGHSLLAGLDWYADRLHSTTAYATTSRWNRALLLQHSFRGERFGSEAGLRHDDNQQFGAHTTLNGALRFAPNADQQIVLSYAEGFRAPTFNDLYWPDSCYAGTCYHSANPDLKPERSRSYELQWRAELAAHSRLEVSLYRTELRDAIVFGDLPRNVQRARIDGVEAQWRQELGGWQATLGASLLDPRDRASGHTLERRARRTLNLDLDRRFGRFGVGASWQAVSSSYDDAANTRRIAGYGLLGLRGDWQVSDALRLAVKLDNALGRQYSRALYDDDFDGRYDAYRQEGRTALLALTWEPELR